MKLQKYLYLGFFAISVILTFFTVIASVSGTSGTQDSIFRSVWTVFLLAAYVLIQVVCLCTARPKKITVYRGGFYALHIGLVLFLVGSFVYYISGDIVNVSVPVDHTSVYSQIKREQPDANGNDMLKLDFSLGISDFEVERYPAEEGEGAVDKYYEATLMLMPEGSREIEEKPLIVNRPQREGGWKIYLMNYDRVTESNVQLMLKYDPGEYITLAGLWLTILGTFVMCFARKRKAGGENE